MTVAKLWQEEFTVSENQKTNDLIFVSLTRKAWSTFSTVALDIATQSWVDDLSNGAGTVCFVPVSD